MTGFSGCGFQFFGASIVIAVLGFTGLALGADADPHDTKLGHPSIHLTLEDAVATGLRQATLVLKSKNQTEITGSDLAQAYAEFLPNLGVTADYGIQSGRTLVITSDVARVDSTYRQGGFQVSSTLNLFNGFGDRAALGGADKRDQAAKLSFARAKEQIELDITQSYLQVILDEELAQIDAQNLEVSKQRSKLFQAEKRSERLTQPISTGRSRKPLQTRRG